ncbi:hypothetical protein R1sor_026552 [Riccia sorocarpa]|uniref:Uncharacterized protein n=1 Tax=Riccia sorocarpa TaxID=122646 RepID=A0ABD3GDS7_9MARC
MDEHATMGIMACERGDAHLLLHIQDAHEWSTYIQTIMREESPELKPQKLPITPPCTMKTTNELDKATKPAYVTLNRNEHEPNTNEGAADPIAKDRTQSTKEADGQKKPYDVNNIEETELNIDSKRRTYYQNVVDVIDSDVGKIQEMINAGADPATIAEDLLYACYNILTKRKIRLDMEETLRCMKKEPSSPAPPDFIPLVRPICSNEEFVDHRHDTSLPSTSSPDGDEE